MMLLAKCLKSLLFNNLYQYLINHFNADRVKEVMLIYKIGSSGKWDKSTVFYQIDKYQRCRTGKVMQYSTKDGKRDAKIESFRVGEQKMSESHWQRRYANS
jgi:hypothetical protein